MVGQNGGNFNTKQKNYKKPQFGQQENPYYSPVNPNHYCSDAGLGYMGYNRDNCFYGSLAGDKENHISTCGFMGSDFGGKDNEISLSEIRHSTRTPFDTELFNREKVSFTTYNDGQSQAGRKGSKKGKKLFEDGSEMKRTGHLIGSVSYINSPLGSPSNPPKIDAPKSPMRLNKEEKQRKQKCAQHVKSVQQAFNSYNKLSPHTKSNHSGSKDSYPGHQSSEKILLGKSVDFQEAQISMTPRDSQVVYPDLEKSVGDFSPMDNKSIQKICESNPSILTENLIIYIPQNEKKPEEPIISSPNLSARNSLGCGLFYGGNKPVGLWSDQPRVTVENSSYIVEKDLLTQISDSKQSPSHHTSKRHQQ